MRVALSRQDALARIVLDTCNTARELWREKSMDLGDGKNIVYLDDSNEDDNQSTRLKHSNTVVSSFADFSKSIAVSCIHFTLQLCL